jgi:cytochrome c oxidase subunit 4
MSNGAAVSPEMTAAAEHVEPNYIAIWIYLAVLTALELVVAYAPIPKPAMVGGLVGLAWAKAVLVAMYFMHLRFERRTLGVIALIPILLITFLTFMLVPDLSTRIYARHHMGEVVRMERALEKDVSGPNPNVNPPPAQP